MLPRWLEPAAEIVWPAACIACDVPRPEGALCRPCRDTLVPGDGAGCPRCGLIRLELPATGGHHLCGTCLREPPPWERARAAWAYGGALRDAVARWKNVPDHRLGPAIAALLTERAEASGWAELPGSVRVVPVPGHPRRIRARGFHPAGLLARALARRLALPLEPLGLRARHPPPSSRGLDRRARQRRLGRAFEGRRRRLERARILLVDDVMTTGATARAASRACLRAGARGVEVAVLARTPRD